MACVGTGAGISPANQSVDFAEWYLQSALGKHNAQELQELTTQGVRSSTELRITFTSRYAAPLYVQLKVRDPGHGSDKLSPMPSYSNDEKPLARSRELAQ